MEGKLGIYVRTSIEKENMSIPQQKKLGIEFSKKHNFEYIIYEDIGKSGYNDDIENREGLQNLIYDIEKKIINKIWISENSRLSRNESVSIFLSRIFQKYNIIIYENGKEFDLNNPQSKMINSILSTISQYERTLIVNRTTRGFHFHINSGNRSYSELYGYKKIGTDEKGYSKWKPVNSELEQVKYCFEKYLQGNSVKSIIQDITKKIPNGTIIHKWIRILRHFEYTGNSFNTEGLKIYNQFKKCQLESLSELNDNKYYVSSNCYPIKIVSVEDWIKTVEKLQGYKKIYKDRMRRTDKEILTGIINCPICNLRYYFCKDKKYSYLKHSPNSKCHQSPKSFNTKNMNDLISVFYFYYFLVYDDTKILIEENQKIIKLNLSEIKDKISSVSTDNNKIIKQISRFNDIYENTDDKELLKLTLIKEKELNNKKDINDNLLIKLKNELEELKDKYNKDELELTYYSVKENIINWFEKFTIDEKRTSLIKIIKTSLIFGKYLIIDTSNLLFIFDTRINYELPKNIYSNFKKDKNFKSNFINSGKLINDTGELSKMILDIKDGKKNKYSLQERRNLIKNMWDYFQSRNLGELIIREYYLLNKDNIKIKSIMKDKLSEMGIHYDLSEIKTIISFCEI